MVGLRVVFGNVIDRRWLVGDIFVDSEYIGRTLYQSRFDYRSRQLLALLLDLNYR